MIQDQFESVYRKECNLKRGAFLLHRFEERESEVTVEIVLSQLINIKRFSGKEIQFKI